VSARTVLVRSAGKPGDNLCAPVVRSLLSRPAQLNTPQPVTTDSPAPCAPALPHADGSPCGLLLADGTAWPGQSFGAPRAVRGEVVFHTGMVGYTETLTDPSYRGQILVLTYPLQGNYGVPAADSADGFESNRVQVQGLIVAHHAEHYSHHAAVCSLGDWLRGAGVPALLGVDTRALTRHLRAHGTLEGVLAAGGPAAAHTGTEADTVDMERVAEYVEPESISTYSGPGPCILLIDIGAKESLIRSLRKRSACIVRAPGSAPWEGLLDGVDGVVLSNGPGDPRHLGQLTERVRALFGHRGSGLPIFGVCLGHQILARAAGAETYKLPFGHRSHNQPVLELPSRRAYVTSQNHGHAVRTDSLPPDWTPWFVNLNDDTSEGIRHRHHPFFSVQFHPEGAAGPRDTSFLFDEFLGLVSARAARRRA